MEHLVLKQLHMQVDSQLNSNQFAFKSRRSVDDAISLLIHLVTEHLEQPGHHARILFVDFSSAFNTMRLSLLVAKVLGMNVNPALCRWILNFLEQWPQKVKVNGCHSSPRNT